MKAVAMLFNLPTHVRVLIDQVGNKNPWVGEFRSFKEAWLAIASVGIDVTHNRVVNSDGSEDVILAFGRNISIASLESLGFVKLFSSGV